MTDPKRAKFFHAAIEISHKDKTALLKGMASERGVTRIALESVPAFVRGMAGKSITVKIESMVFHAIISQQFTSSDSFFEMQFIDLLSHQKEFLQQRLDLQGAEPDWHRKFPRIPVVGLSDPDLPVPNLCMIHYAGEQVFASVVNFTLGGIRIEVMSEVFRDIKVGARLEFDLISSAGDIMSGLKGDIKNISVREQYSGSEKNVIRGFGIKIFNMDSANAKKYRSLIKEYCIALKKKLQDEGDDEEEY